MRDSIDAHMTFFYHHSIECKFTKMYNIVSSIEDGYIILIKQYVRIPN